MVDLSRTIIAKSDQLNADDLLGGPITVKVQAVKEGNSDQPVAILYEGCNGKPFYPCKSMRRVLVNVWGKNGTDYAGKSMTLYRDPNVKFGGIMVGGIRISHMTGLEKDMPMALQVTKGSKKLFTVKPLRVQQEQQVAQQDPWAPWVQKWVKALSEAPTLESLEILTSNAKYRDGLEKLKGRNDARGQELQAIASKRAAELSEVAAQPEDDMVPA
ncbi:hypothetical protein M2305_000065 [Gluconobacter cerinus]|uniref:hypothetical protein n=1 Tax=Gluconobacter cerinus TaxID=38307 RepID=UPI0022280A07|nr:hypothetical protein [Gluconobacter cerinus]MCW2264118.1 hypothetical protein [Gluconobacter cerinus]